MSRMVAIALFFLAGCAASGGSDLYEGKYIVLERVESGYKLNERIYEPDTVAALIQDLEDERSNKVLLGQDTEFTMGDLLNLGPQLKRAGFELFFLGSDGTVNSAGFAFD